MPTTAKDLSTELDPTAIADEAHQQWKRKQLRRLSLSRVIVRAVPIMLVVTFLTFYLLSAPHTVHILNAITPGWGWVAPVGFELGVLTISALREAGWNNTLTVTIVWTLLLASVVINWAGGFIAVVTTMTPPSPDLAADPTAAPIEIARLTTTELIERFDTLPAVGQVALVLVGVIGALIPFMSKFSGEAVVKLAMGKIKLEEQDDEQEWARDSRAAVRKALLSAALNQGAGVKTAGKWATEVTQQMYPDDDYVPPPTLPAPRYPAAANPARAEIGFHGIADRRGQDRTGQGTVFVSPEMSSVSHPVFPQIGKKDSPDSPAAADLSAPQTLRRRMVLEWLRDNGERWRDMSNEQISAEIIGAETGYKTVQRVLRDTGRDRREG